MHGHLLIARAEVFENKVLRKTFGLKMDEITGHWMRSEVFENKVLRKTFGPKRDEITGHWMRQHNEELCVFCYFPSITLGTKFVWYLSYTG